MSTTSTAVDWFDEKSRMLAIRQATAEHAHEPDVSWEEHHENVRSRLVPWAQATGLPFEGVYPKVGASSVAMPLCSWHDMRVRVLYIEGKSYVFHDLASARFGVFLRYWRVNGSRVVRQVYLAEARRTCPCFLCEMGELMEWPALRRGRAVTERQYAAIRKGFDVRGFDSWPVPERFIDAMHVLEEMFSERKRR